MATASNARAHRSHAGVDGIADCEELSLFIFSLILPARCRHSIPPAQGGGRFCGLIFLALHSRSRQDAFSYNRSAMLPTGHWGWAACRPLSLPPRLEFGLAVPDRKSTRLNSSHLGIPYAV